MNPQAIIAALPWVRRGWRLLPPQARPFVLVVGAGVAIWYAVSGNKELAELRRKDERDPGRTSSPTA
ncbi:hypothetical protein FTX61_03865 [Nitriliruptoraceae bacterium ZYF776]|nr:hypothetical protein [Profundirhabdus halotolerans]